MKVETTAAVQNNTTADAGTADANAQGAGANATGTPAPTGTPTPTTESAAKVVPEKYELKLPDGALLKPAHLEQLASYAKEQKLSNVEAQALLERENLAAVSFHKGLQDQVEAESNQWVKEIEADKELGGDAFKENVALANRVVSKFGTEKLRMELDRTRLGNHPELNRLLVRIGKAFGEDRLVLPGAQNNLGGGNNVPTEDLLYGAQKQ